MDINVINQKNIGYSPNNNEILDWLNDMSKVRDNYIDFLKSNYFYNIDNSHTAEVVKNEYDIITQKFKTKIIIPRNIDYKFSKNKYIVGDFFVMDGKPILSKQTGCEIPITSDEINLYMTQNPYSFDDIKNWDKIYLMNKGLINILVGVYGYNIDSNKKEKIQILKYLKEKLSYDSYIEKMEENNGEYFYAFQTKCIKKQY